MSRWASSEWCQDFLPAPGGLVFREERIKVTLALSKRSVESFKQEAAKHNTQPAHDRQLLDAYAELHAQTRDHRTSKVRLRRAR